MRKHNIVLWIIISIITFGIGAIVWMVRTKNDMNTRGAGIPTAWLMIVPIISIWWMWKWAVGVEIATGKKMSSPVAFLLVFLLSLIGMAIIQVQLNAASDADQLPSAA
ncbi:MAG: DUF4234 domain-containing protein [Myxococcales bacterium]|nr:DUF4234 domain-containing protein [Myxococcales bacterium]